MLVRTTIAVLAFSGLVACRMQGNSFLRSDEAPVAIPPSEDELAELETTGYQSFAYYEGLSPSELRSGSRTDGTSSGMPCISRAEIARGQETEHRFWHGHENEQHMFTLTREHYSMLLSGKPVQVYTSVVDEHRHAFVIDPRKTCRPAPPERRSSESTGQAGRSYFQCKQLSANAYRPYFMKWDEATRTHIDYSTRPKGLLGASPMGSAAECQRALENANHDYGVICSATGIGWKPTLYTGTVPGREDYGYLGGSSMNRFEDCLLAVRNSSSKGVCYWGGVGPYYISPIDRAGSAGGPFDRLEDCVAQTRQ